MAIRLCPECGGKCTTTRDDCPHCGYVFPKKKKCPECESEIDDNLKECPECGYTFNQGNPVSKAVSAGPVTGQRSVKLAPTEKPNANEKQSSNVVCDTCGSTDCIMLDDYTYRCNHCGSVIKIAKPDVNVYNFNNTIQGDAGDIPVYQLKKNLSEKEFERASIITMAKDSHVSAELLEAFKADPSMVKLRYLTFVEKEYTVNVHYSCQVGTDYTVTYYENGREKTKTQTKWEPFSGSGSDGGTGTINAYGDSGTDFRSLGIYFRPYSSNEFEPFVEQSLYPLKTNANKEAVKWFQDNKISDLEYQLKDNLPGNHYRDWRASGNCQLGNTLTYYYVPCYSLTAMPNGHKTEFVGVANTDYTSFIRRHFEEDEKDVNSGNQTEPKPIQAKKAMGTTVFGKLSIIMIILLSILIAGFVVAMALEISWAGITYPYNDDYVHANYNFAPPFFGIILAVTGLIVVCVTRKATRKRIYDNLLFRFRTRMIKACEKCLSDNGLEALNDEEKGSIMSYTKKKRNTRMKEKNIYMTVFFALLLIQFIYSLIWTIAGNHFSSDEPMVYTIISSILLGISTCLLIYVLIRYLTVRNKD